MTSVGEALRRERLRRGFELEQISRELKISSRFLEAIEDDDFKKLPGGVFAKSFVRQYARLLSLDEEELATEVQRLIEPEALALPIVEPGGQPPELHLPRVTSFPGSRDRRSPLPALAMVVVVMLVCSVVYNWWQRRAEVSAHQQTASVTQPAQPEQPVASPPATPQTQAQEPPPAVTSEPSPVPAGQASVPAGQTPSPAAQADANTADRPAVDPGPPPAARPPLTPPVEPGTANRPPQPTKGPVRLELTADVAVWVLAQSNGKYLFSGTIDANQTRTVEASGPIVLRLGNAGALKFTLNGKPLGAVGSKGQVMTVQFTSGGFQIVAAPKPVLLDPIGGF